MADFTIEMSKISTGHSFRRSDGQIFFMILRDDATGSLYAGSPDRPPSEDIVGFDSNISNKLEAAQPYILGYKRKAVLG
jgi:hypothetical protein